MKLGFIQTNRADQDKALSVLKMTTESDALDELGIGRIRDAFADMIFPGISTLQKHTKYFSLMPQVYKKAIEKRYNRPSEVKAEIVRLERVLTKNLCAGSPGCAGITGSEMISKDSNSYVKYDPAYIYNSGLQTFEILRTPQVSQLIYNTSKALHDAPTAHRSNNEESADDSPEKAGLFQFCSFPTVEYDFTKACTLDLTKGDTDFITSHILGAKACKGTLLRYLVENHDYVLPDKFDGFTNLPPELAAMQDMARRFADFIYMVHVRYNYIFSKYEDKEMLDEFNALLQTYRHSGTDIAAVLSTINIREKSCIDFCDQVAKTLSNKDLNDGGALDQLIINRERRVKQNRRKIGNPKYPYSKSKRIHYYKLTYRWETVKLFIEEIRKGTADG